MSKIIEMLYNLRFSVPGTDNGQTINGFPLTNRTLSRLKLNAEYEWQVMSECEEVE